MLHEIHFHEFKDGSYLAEFLIKKGYKVHGIMRRSSSFNTGRIQHLYKDPMTHLQDCKSPSLCRFSKAT